MQGPVSCGAVRRVLKTERDGCNRGKGGKRAKVDPAATPPPPSSLRFPRFERPYPEEARAARDALAALHGEYENSNDRSVVDSLVSTMLSQNTTDITSARAFKQLKEDFPGGWDEVRLAPEDSVAEAIRCCGLAQIRASRIQAILNQVHTERGETDMEYVRELDDEAAKRELTRFKGVGPKTAACVLMFCLGRSEFPVDTHVWRITRDLGWAPKNASREDTYDHLNEKIPDDIKFSLHVLLVEHGKSCTRCAKNGQPRRTPLGECPLFGRGKAKASLVRPSSKAGGQRAADGITMPKKIAVKEEAEQKGDAVSAGEDHPNHGETEVRVKMEVAAIKTEIKE